VDSGSTLLVAFVLFVLAFAFWAWCLSFWDRPQSMIAFWYAAGLEFLGYLTLTFWAVTFR
jgi:hypothetical protein